MQAGWEIKILATVGSIGGEVLYNSPEGVTTLLFSDYMGDDNIVLNPDVVSGVYAFKSAMFFFLKNGLWELCDQGA